MMEEPKLEDKEKVIEKLTPFWKKYWEKEEKFRNASDNYANRK